MLNHHFLKKATWIASFLAFAAPYSALANTFDNSIKQLKNRSDTTTLIAPRTENTPPTSQNAVLTINEDNKHTFSAADFPFSDNNNDSLNAVQFAGLPKKGKLMFDDTPLSENDELITADLSRLTYTPPINQFGDNLAHFYFWVKDQGGEYSNYQQMTINVTASNDPIGFFPPMSTGKTRVGFIPYQYSYAYSVAIAKDGSIFLAGASDTSKKKDFAITKLTPSGTLDTSFGDNGKVMVDFGINEDETAQDIAIAPDGKIYVGGYSGGYYNEKNIAIIKLNTDGTLDTSFDNDGKLLLNTSSDDSAHSLAIDKQGAVYIAGSSSVDRNAEKDFAILKLTTNGTLDTTFGTDGKVLVDFAGHSDEAQALIMTEDGALIAVGAAGNDANDDFAIVKLTADGALDTTFGEANQGIKTGKAQFDILGSSDTANSVGIDSAGALYLAGSAHDGTNYNFTVVKLTAGGQLDPDFGNEDSSGIKTGKKTINFNNNNSNSARSLVINADNSVVIAGFMTHSDGQYFALAKLTAQGALDNKFGDNGTALLSLGTDDSNDTARSLAVNLDGSLIVTGYSLGGRSYLINDFAVAKLTSTGQLDYSFGHYAAYAANGYQSQSSLDETAIFQQGDTPVIMDTDVFIYDVDLNPSSQADTGNYSGVTLSVKRQNQANPDDEFTGNKHTDDHHVKLENDNVFLNSDLVGSFNQNGGQLTLTFADTTTQQQINRVASGLSYKNTAANPPENVTIIWTVSDGESQNSGTTNVQIIMTNHAGVALIDGQPVQGGTLTASVSDADGLTNASLTYQWFADDVEISQATNPTYQLTQNEVGKKVTVQVSYTDNRQHNEVATSSPTKAIENINDLPTGSITINGEPTVGKIVTATHTIVDIDGFDAAAGHYQWHANSIDIPNATEKTYTLTAAEANKSLTVTISYQDKWGTNERVTSAAVTVRQPASTVIYLLSDSFESTTNNPKVK